MVRPLTPLLLVPQLLAALATALPATAYAASPQGTVQVGFVIDLGREVRAGFELVGDVRVATNPYVGASPTLGAVARVGWRHKAGATASFAARGGVAYAPGCDESTHIVILGGEGEAGVELSGRLPPALIVGVDGVFGSLWFGLNGTMRVSARVDREGFDAIQLAHDAGVVVAYPDCGWPLLD